MIKQFLTHVISFVALLFLAALPSATTAGIPWGTSRCYPKSPGSALIQDDCVIAARDFFYSHNLPHYTFRRSSPSLPRAQPYTINCPSQVTRGTCSLVFLMTGLGPSSEQHETPYMMTRALTVAKLCANAGQTGGFMRIGESMYLGYVLSETLPKGDSLRVGGLQDGENRTSIDLE